MDWAGKWLALILAVSFWTSIFGLDQARFERPNIVVIQADDLGWNDVSFHGANQIPTPNIDALAYNGLILNRHYVLPSCTPSRTAFLTGRYPMRTGMQGYPLLAGEGRGIPLTMKLFPQYLKNLGYVTRLVGKWHVGYYTKYHTPTYRGFDSFFGYYNGYIQYYNYTITQNDMVGLDLHRDVFTFLNTTVASGYFTDVITEEAVHVIQSHDTSRPLYLQVNHLAPHSSDADEPMEVRDEKEMNDLFGHIKDRNRRRFASMMNSLDESVGKIVTSLKNTGMLKNSIILFMSDNGAQTEGILENFGSNYPLRGLKFTLFEGAIRGVACLYSPLIKQSGRVLNQLIHVADWLPTLYSAAGGDVNDLEDIDGKNQWPVFQNTRKKARDFILLNIDEIEQSEAAMVDRFKYIKGARALYGDYYGDNGRSKRNPEYNVSDVMNSATNRAIGKTFGSTVSAGTIKSLRSKSEVKCKKPTNFPSCFKKCLFDIVNDPCETKDLTDKYPEVVEILEETIDEFRGNLVNQPRKPVDSAANPDHFNGYWMPWIECQNCSLTCHKKTSYTLSQHWKISFEHLCS